MSDFELSEQEKAERRASNAALVAKLKADLGPISDQDLRKVRAQVKACRRAKVSLRVLLRRG